MNKYLKKINNNSPLILFVFILLLINFAPYPPLSSTYNLRIVNRRFVSYIVFENINNKLFLTILLTHGPNYLAFKSNLYRLYYECKDPENCLKEAKKLNSFLQTGYNIAFVIEGDFIKKIIYLEPENEK